MGHPACIDSGGEDFLLPLITDSQYTTNSQSKGNPMPLVSIPRSCPDGDFYARSASVSRSSVFRLLQSQLLAAISGGATKGPNGTREPKPAIPARNRRSARVVARYDHPPDPGRYGERTTGE